MTHIASRRPGKRWYRRVRPETGAKGVITLINILKRFQLGRGNDHSQMKRRSWLYLIDTMVAYEAKLSSVITILYSPEKGPRLFDKPWTRSLKIEQLYNN